MKFSPSVIITITVMVLLVAALVVLAFSLGNQYAVFRLAKSTLPSQEISSATTTTPEVAPPMTLPNVPRLTDEHYLDRALRGTVLNFSEMKFGDEFTLPLLAGASTETNDVYVYVTDVVFDSRCPENVDCIAAGEGIVEVEMQVLGKPTQTVYLSTQTGGKPDYWSYHGLRDDSFMTPEVKAEIARGQKIVAETTYIKGETYRTGGAVIDGYIIGMRGLTPNRIYRGDAGTPVIDKADYRATLVISPAPRPL